MGRNTKKITSSSEVLTGALLNPGRDEEAGHAHPEPIKLEVVRVRANNPIRLRHFDDRRGNMVIEATMLIIGDDESRLVPLRARPQRLVDLLDKSLSPGDVVRRV